MRKWGDKGMWLTPRPLTGQAVPQIGDLGVPADRLSSTPGSATLTSMPVLIAADGAPITTTGLDYVPPAIPAARP